MADPRDVIVTPVLLLMTTNPLLGTRILSDIES